VSELGSRTGQVVSPNWGVRRTTSLPRFAWHCGSDHRAGNQITVTGSALMPR
jgi:hypothetical protein